MDRREFILAAVSAGGAAFLGFEPVEPSVPSPAQKYQGIGIQVRYELDSLGFLWRHAVYPDDALWHGMWKETSTLVRNVRDLSILGGQDHYRFAGQWREDEIRRLIDEQGVPSDLDGWITEQYRIATEREQHGRDEN